MACVKWILLLCLLGFSFNQVAYSKKGEEKARRVQEDFSSYDLLAELEASKALSENPSSQEASSLSKKPEKKNEKATIEEEEEDDVEGVSEMEKEEPPLPEFVDRAPAPSLDSSIRVIPKSSSSTMPLYVPPKDLAVSLPRLLDLPESIQESIPEFKFMGHLYSTRPGKSSVIIKNKLLYEGEEVAPAVLLEKVTEKGAILSYQGTRFQIEVWGSQFYQ
ncbi:MAG: general secretion pathway protein GspB [Gammaproteobacteria bacterium]|nr:general secretion pathway protein GspB [Gammaproteobacteria bacterium]